jgi:3'(2'), 5'-bisphosphate nucleotidase
MRKSMHDQEMFFLAVKAALQAGRSILDIYDSEEFEVEKKEDDSPLTKADRSSHAIIIDYLKDTGVPVLSEEGSQVDFSERKDWDPLWIVDPLDGTKEFIKRNGEFTVNIALIEDRRPKWGVIYVPVKKLLYLGLASEGAFCVQDIDLENMPASMQELLHRAQKLPLKRDEGRKSYVIIGSRSHGGEELEAFVREKEREYGQVEFISAGSSLKFCKVAEGKADIYPRLGPTMEWDTAAGQAIVEAAGKSVRVWESGEELRYNRVELRNPWFVVQ